MRDAKWRTVLRDLIEWVKNDETVSWRPFSWLRVLRAELLAPRGGSERYAFQQWAGRWRESERPSTILLLRWRLAQLRTPGCTFGPIIVGVKSGLIPRYERYELPGSSGAISIHRDSKGRMSEHRISAEGFCEECDWIRPQDASSWPGIG